MKRFLALLLVTLLTFTMTFTVAFASDYEEDMKIVHSYTWREIVAYDGYQEGNIPEEVLILTDLNCFQQLVWLLGEETSDLIDLKLTIFANGDIAVRATSSGESRGVHYWADQDFYTWMHSSIDDKIHVLLNDDLIDFLLHFAETEVNTTETEEVPD